jgi:hypothetical protein
MEAGNVAQVTLAPMTLYYPEQFWAHHGSKQCCSSHTGGNDFVISRTILLPAMEASNVAQVTLAPMTLYYP